jgi:hypothetical protein
MDIEVEKCDQEKEVVTNTGGERVVVKDEVCYLLCELFLRLGN